VLDAKASTKRQIDEFVAKRSRLAFKRTSQTTADAAKLVADAAKQAREQECGRVGDNCRRRQYAPKRRQGSGEQGCNRSLRSDRGGVEAVARAEGRDHGRHARPTGPLTTKEFVESLQYFRRSCGIESKVIGEKVYLMDVQLAPDVVPAELGYKGVPRAPSTSSALQLGVSPIRSPPACAPRSVLVGVRRTFFYLGRAEHTLSPERLLAQPQS